MSSADARFTTDAARAAQVLRDGGLIGLPTETVYGLGADAGNAQAVMRIFSTKQRPADHPLIVHIHQPAQMRQWARDVPPAAWQLAEAFWPGPLTLVMPRAQGVIDLVTGGLDTVALRIPAHPLALELLGQFGGGVAAPSANRHGRVSPTTAQHVRSEFGDAVDLLLDGGPCRVGIESTIVDFVEEGVRILRPGCITTRKLRRVTGRTVFDRADPAVRRPGAMRSHYAPRATVVLTAAEDAPAALETWQRNGARPGLLSAYRPEQLPAGVPWLSLGATREQQAQKLYALLRQADDLGLDVLVVVPPRDKGVGAALCDRLVRAAGLGDGRVLGD